MKDQSEATQAELVRWMYDGCHTVITGDGLVLVQPPNPIGMVIVYSEDHRQPLMGVSDSGDEEVANLSLYVPGNLTTENCGEGPGERTHQVLDLVIP